MKLYTAIDNAMERHATILVGVRRMIKIWGRKSSSNVQAAMWCVAELALEHTRVDAGFTYGVVDSAGYRQMNPNGTIPTLQDSNGVIVWETGADFKIPGRKLWFGQLLAL